MMRKPFSFLFLLMLLLHGSLLEVVEAALNAYLTMTGDTQGEVKGTVTQKGREDWIYVYDIRHELISPMTPLRACQRANDNTNQLPLPRK